MSRIDPEDLKALILEGDRGDTLYVPNSGNAGDSLIAEATYQFLDRIGLSYAAGTLDDRLSSPRRVIVGGGGNLVKPYPNVYNFLTRNLDQIEQLIILPHTIQSYEDLLVRLDGRCTLICREERSFDFCRKHAKDATVLIGHDMALLWRREETARKARSSLFSHLNDPVFNLRNLKHLARRIHHRGKIRNGTLNAFRQDVEARSEQIPADNIDLSQAFATDSMARAYAACAVDSLARFIEGAQTVRTDRLHITILSAILGKAVEMHDNNYGKNRAIYDYSLASRFSNISFVK